MKLNTEPINSSKDYFQNIYSNSSPDIIEQVDKVINKYKNQLEQLKYKNDLNALNMDYNLSIEKINNYSGNMKTEPDQYFINTSKNIEYKKNYVNKENNNYIYEENKEEENNYNIQNKNKYNFQYNKLNKYDDFYDINKNNDLSNNNLAYEMKNDNIKLGSALTLEKSKVVQLLYLLKMKDNEIYNLKLKIENFEEKVNELENKYQNIINSIEQEQSNKLNDIYNNISDENNKLKVDYNEIKRNSEIQIEEINNELNNNKKIIKIFFDLFNKNLELFKNTDIIQSSQNLYITENNFTEENAFFAVGCIDKLINKLVQDNKDLFNELLRLKGQIDNNNNLISEPINNYIQQENNSLRQLVYNLKTENNYLKNNKSYNDIRINQNKNNFELSQNTKTQGINIEVKPNHHHHIVNSVCKHCTTDCFKNTIQSNQMDQSPFEKIKIKINNLENQLRNQTYY